MLNRYEKIRIVVAVDNGSVDYTIGKAIIGEFNMLIISVSFPFPNERYQKLDTLRRRDDEFSGGKN